MVAALEDYIRLLLKRRNPDGGWGYYAGKSSWLEPTAYAALALHGRPESKEAMELLQSWQAESGAWVAQPKTGIESWATSLVVVLKCVCGEHDKSWRRGVDWIVRTSGKQKEPPTWLDKMLGRKPLVYQDETLVGWPWTVGTANWVEPTAQAMRALRLSVRQGEHAAAEERIREAELFLMDRRCKDGGWNHGNKRVLEEDLPSYPESTALALIGLSGNPSLDLSKSLRRAQQDWTKPQSTLARALARIGLRMQGIAFADQRPQLGDQTETTQIALSLIGEPDGSWRLWRGDA